MAGKIKVKIDGRQTQVPEGMNLIDAAQLAGVHIPNLCYLKGLKGVGACRLCLVEVEGMKAPLTACTTKVKDGMAVTTNSEKIDEVRKFVIDLVLSMHPLDCMTCTKAGVCRLQKYAYDMNIKESSFTRKKSGYPADEANPFIKRDPEYCVLCGRCVRVCKDQGTDVLEFMGRGVGSKVITANDKPLQESGCTFCGSCIDVCPVNAFLEGGRSRKGREWDYENVNSTCLLCGNGCEINVSTKDGRVMKVNSGAAEGSAERYICAYGRYGFDCIEADSRVTAPMKRVDGELKETTWQDAIETVAARLKGAGKDAGFIASAGLLNEDALTLAKLAEAVKTPNVDTTAGLYSSPDTLVSDSVADIDSADLFVVVDLNPDQWKRVLPAVGAAIRKRLGAGAKLIVINSSETALSAVAAVNMTGSEADSLKSLAKAMIDKGLNGNRELASAVSGAASSEEAEKAAALVSEAKNPVVLTSPSMYLAAANIGLLKGKVVSVPVESNAKGVAAMGLRGAGKSYKEMAAGGVKVLYTVGEVPVNERPDAEFLVVQGSHMTEIAKQADVVLPAAAYLEADGTIIDYLGRLRKICKAIGPAGEAKPHRKIFAEVAKAMGADLKEASEGDAKKLAAAVKSARKLSPFQRTGGFDVKPEELIESLNASVINGSRLLWLKEAKVQA
ncbi:MAG: molybdopterin-dependent oxidoreductase [Nitrospiraceae bacterium]|nr:molybdopterin-dependent oxidoreductase [Nitrospiraceae bacterium]